MKKLYMPSADLNVLFCGGLGMGGFTSLANAVHNSPQGIRFFFPRRLVSLARYGGVELPAERVLPAMDLGLSTAVLRFPGVSRFLVRKNYNLPPVRFLHLAPKEASKIDATFSYMKPLVHNKPWVFAFDHVPGHYWIGQPFPPWSKKLLQRVLSAPNCKAILPESRWALGLLAERTVNLRALEHKITIVPPFPMASAPEKKFPPAGDPVRFLLVGKAFERKGGFEALSAFESLANEMEGIEFHLVGSHGAVHERILSRIQAMAPDVRPRVHAHGSMEYKGIGSVFGQCDVYVMPSRYECFGAAFTEAMNFSLPVIASRVDAVPEIVEDGRTGLLVEKENGGQLLDAMRSLASSASLRKKMGRAGKERFEEKFGSKPMHEKLRKVLSEAAGKG